MSKRDAKHLIIIYTLVIVAALLVWAYIGTTMNGRM